MHQQQQQQSNPMNQLMHSPMHAGSQPHGAQGPNPGATTATAGAPMGAVPPGQAPNPASSTLLDSKLDHASQCKLLTDKLKQVLAETMRSAAQCISYNARLTSGSLRQTDAPSQHLEANFEKCLSLCDLIELNLRTAIQCSEQSVCSQRFTPLPVGMVRSDGSHPSVEPLSYNQYMGTVRCQIQLADEVKSMLLETSQMCSSSGNSTMVDSQT